MTIVEYYMILLLNFILRNHQTMINTKQDLSAVEFDICKNILSFQGGIISLTSISYNSKSRLFVFKIILGEPHDIIAPLVIAPHSFIFAFPELIPHLPSSIFSCTLT